MVKKCSVPRCSGNYATGPSVSVFSFPKDPGLREQWIRAIHRENFTPTKNTVVCELHFHAQDIERETSMYDSRTGRLLTAPLDRPRLKKGAIPSVLPGCPKYLSSEAAASREDPDDRRQRIENETFRSALAASLQTHNDHLSRIVTRWRWCEQVKL